MYIAEPDVSSEKFHKKFRRPFRMRYNMFRYLMLMVKNEELFARWMSCDAVGCPSSPLSLLLLGALRYLGRGCTFDDLEEATGIHEETHRQFFHVGYHPSGTSPSTDTVLAVSLSSSSCATDSWFSSTVGFPFVKL